MDRVRQVTSLFKRHRGNISLIAAEMELSRPTVHYWLERAGLREPPASRREAQERRAAPASAVPEEPAERRELAVLRAENTRLRSELQRADLGAAEAADIRRHVLRLAESEMAPPRWVERPVKSASSPGVPVLFLSDLHYGEVAHANMLHGVNSYDCATASRRFMTVVERAIHISKRHIVNPDYPGIVLLLGGDMVSGDIHLELLKTNGAPILQQTLEALGLCCRAIDRLLAEFERVYVVCTYGNHGRLTVKPELKGRAGSNVDWLIGQLIEREYSEVRKDKRVSVLAPTAPDCFYEVMGWRHMLTHGDLLGAKGGDGFIGSIGPIIRGTTKTERSVGHAGHSIDVMNIGHWHQYMPLGRVIVNGSIVGWSEYAALQLRATPEAPQQALYFVHPDHGVTNHWAIFAESGSSRPFRRSAPVVWPSPS